MRAPPVNNGGPEIVFTAYRPHPGKDDALAAIVAQHTPLLRQLELITNRPVIVARARDGAVIEVFEWATYAAAGVAHQHPDVARMWESIGAVADIISLSDLHETRAPFAHYRPI